MKTNTIRIIAAAAAALGPKLAFAAPAMGPSSSGGGAALVCRAEGGTIRFAELLDLYEARTVFYFPLAKATGTVTRDYFLAAANTYRLQGAPGLADRERETINEGLKRFFDIAKMTAPGVKLPVLKDLGTVPRIPPGCALEQLAIFHDETPNRVEIDSEIWNALDSLNRSALVTHEAMYFYERKLQQRTSETTRAFVAHVYAQEGAVEPVRTGVPENTPRCMSADPRFQTTTSRGGTSYERLSSFDYYPAMTPEGMGTRLQFTQIGGRPELTKTTIEIPGVRFDLKASWDRESKTPVMIVAEEGKNLVMEIPLRGGMYRGLSVEVTYVTGKPVRLAFKDSGTVVTNEFVTSCSQ